MISSSSVDLYLQFVVVFLILVSSIKFLKKKRKNSTEDIQFYQPEKLWSVIKLSYVYLKWVVDLSPRKRPLLEHFYRSSFLKNVVDEGRPKFFKIFNNELFVADDSDSIKDVMNSKECNAILPPQLANITSNGHGHSTGILFTGGPHWTELRKYTVRKLGQLGFNKSDQLSVLLLDLFSDFSANINSIRKKTGNKIPVKDLFVLPTINIVWGIVGGHKIPQDDERFNLLFKSVGLVGNTVKFFWMTVLPDNKIIHYMCGCKPLLDAFKIIYEFLNQFVDERIKLAKPEPEDFVDHFLLEIEKHKDNASLNKYYCKGQLVQILVDLFIAGSDTTSKFMEFSIMYMAQHPEIQKKVQQEIDTVIGKNCLPSYVDHRKSMPYTLATIMETHRMGSVAQYFPKFTLEDWKYKGRVLKKGTPMMCVLWAPRMNESYWGDPSTFRPERFLNEDNSFITDKMNHVMPFGSGLRICPGENVATVSIFTFFVGLLQKYSVSKAFKDELLGGDKCLGMINQPNPFHITISDRF